MLDEMIELVGSTQIAEDIQNKVKTTGVRGLDVEKAKELGFFQRLSNLLCATHASIMAANRIYSEVDYLFTEYNARKNDIAREMNAFEKAFDKFFKFWTDYYASGDAGRDVNEESERLRKQILKWAQLPETWQLGEEQRIEDGLDVAIKVVREDNTDLLFYKTTQNAHNTEEPKESWCVTKYDEEQKKQTTINTEMDKASALMVAKRLSDEDKQSIYVANRVLDIEERRTEIIPFKAFKNNNTIGKIKKVFKQ